MHTFIRAAVFFAIGLASGCLLSPSAVAQAPPDFVALKGRWVRTDGGYVIEIKSVDPGGRLQAAYYNPNPINVSRAEAARSGAAVTVFMELRGPGYPGSTYTLIHDPKADQLKGIYHHAGLQKNFDVVFVRGK
jgi:uncharacterized protein (DUF2147 family)